MKIVAISMVRNEEDIIEAFVRYHARVFDQILVVDHSSVDRSPEILRQLEREGLPLRTRVEPSLIHHQWHVMTSLMREAARDLDADWIVPLDADEFLVPADRGGLEKVLTAMPDQIPARVSLRTYVPTSLDDPARRNPLERITHRKKGERRRWWKALAPSGIAADERYVLTQGNHALGAPGQPLEAEPLPHAALAHFPVRSADQIARKILGGWLTHLARADRLRNEAFQWRRLFAEIAAGRRLSIEELERFALDYGLRTPRTSRPAALLVHDPVPVDFSLRYTEALSASPLSVLARTAEALVEELVPPEKTAGAPQ